MAKNQGNVDANGIIVEVGTDLTKLKEGLIEVKRSLVQSPNKLQIRPEMSFDERLIVKEANRLIGQAERAMAREGAVLKIKTELPQIAGKLDAKILSPGGVGRGGSGEGGVKAMASGMELAAKSAAMFYATIKGVEVAASSVKLVSGVISGNLEAAGEASEQIRQSIKEIPVLGGPIEKVGMILADGASALGNWVTTGKLISFTRQTEEAMALAAEVDKVTEKMQDQLKVMQKINAEAVAVRAEKANEEIRQARSSTEVKVMEIRAERREFEAKAEDYRAATPTGQDSDEIKRGREELIISEEMANRRNRIAREREMRQIALKSEQEKLRAQGKDREAERLQIAEEVQRAKEDLPAGEIALSVSPEDRTVLDARLKSQPGRRGTMTPEEFIAQNELATLGPQEIERRRALATVAEERLAAFDAESPKLQARQREEEIQKQQQARVSDRQEYLQQTGQDLRAKIEDQAMNTLNLMLKSPSSIGRFQSAAGGFGQLGKIIVEDQEKKQAQIERDEKAADHELKARDKSGRIKARDDEEVFADMKIKREEGGVFAQTFDVARGQHVNPAIVSGLGSFGGAFGASASGGGDKQQKTNDLLGEIKEFLKQIAEGKSAATAA